MAPFLTQVMLFLSTRDINLRHANIWSNLVEVAQTPLCSVWHGMKTASCLFLFLFIF